ncbi:MAG: anti-virulence regulator CigR family protein [Pseudomonas sp.]|nr:anti-virulence regulator CigR family protein [Pseudomonas sp.]
MFITRPSLLGATCLAALLSSSLLLADPGNAKNNPGNGQNGKANNSQNGQSNSKAPNNSKAANVSHGNYDDDEYFQRRYDDDLDRILRIFTDHSGQYGQVDPLPPGIRKNLARGKPLPPGIAKKLDPDFARQLPYYQGYEWRQVGSDAALINITTGIVREIMRDVLR